MSLSINYSIIDKLIASGHSVSAMESCTGGLFISSVTDRSGASEIVKGSFVTYSNEAKIIQGVDSDVIGRYGVYSDETAEAMAKAASDAYSSEIGVGITGSLGRVDPNNPDSVSGHVYFSVLMNGEYHSLFITVPDELTERHEMKIFVVNCVLDTIDALI